MTLKATYFGSSGWLIEFGGFRVLVDPWLTGDLSFLPGKWFFHGRLNKEFQLPEKINLLLLTQGLPDHSHPASLKLLSSSIEVVASFSAGSVAKKIGFQKINKIKPGDNLEFGHLKIEATRGAPVPNVENGYILSHPEGSLYLEPHGFFDESLATRKLDAVITPVLDIRLPLAGRIIKGKAALSQLIEKFTPRTVLASTTGGDSTFSGFLNSLMKVEGSINQARDSVSKDVSFIEPIPGETYLINTN